MTMVEADLANRLSVEEQTLLGEAFSALRRERGKEWIVGQWRERWGEMASLRLAELGHDVRIDHQRVADEAAARELVGQWDAARRVGRNSHRGPSLLRGVVRAWACSEGAWWWTTRRGRRTRTDCRYAGQAGAMRAEGATMRASK